MPQLRLGKPKPGIKSQSSVDGPTQSNSPRGIVAILSRGILLSDTVKAGLAGLHTG